MKEDRKRKPIDFALTLICGREVGALTNKERTNLRFLCALFNLAVRVGLLKETDAVKDELQTDENLVNVRRPGIVLIRHR